MLIYYWWQETQAGLMEFYPKNARVHFLESKSPPQSFSCEQKLGDKRRKVRKSRILSEETHRQ
jgi:hypothetical protein